MNKGVEILLERMKSNPDEFVPNDSYSPPTKWGHIINQYNEYLTKEESEALSTAYRETTISVMRERFSQAVMKELLDPKSEENPYLTSNTATGGQTLGQLSNAGLTLTANNNGGVQWANTATQTATSATGNVTIQANSLTLGQTRIQEQELQHMKAHLEYLKMQQEKEQAKHKTLVGKLYNYLHPMAGK